MTVEWTAHRFAGGVLALSLANTVVHRLKPQLRFDRFDDTAEIAAFARAASAHCRAELGGRMLPVGDPGAIRESVIEMREAADAAFRRPPGPQGDPALPRLLRACADCLEQTGSPLPAALATSALALLEPASRGRIRACPNCDWLFLDRSRNGSRLWCDMAVCGNRAKARRHYRRTRPFNGEDHRHA